MFFTVIFVVALLSVQGFAEQARVEFKYEYTEIIIHITPEGQIYNGRANAAYDSTHYFSLFYDLLIKYLGRMELFDPGFTVNDVGVWHEMHMVSQFGSQVLYVGDHIVSDGLSWVHIAEKDYVFLQELINETKKRDREPVVLDRKTLISNMVQTLEITSNGDSYTEHFKKYELTSGSYSRESSSSISAEKIPSRNDADKFSSSSVNDAPSEDSSANTESISGKKDTIVDGNFSSRSISPARFEGDPAEDVIVVADEKSLWADRWLFVVIVVLIASFIYFLKK